MKLFETNDNSKYGSVDNLSYESIVDMYTDSIHSMYTMTAGQIRGAKGDLVENTVDVIVKLAWHEIGGEEDRLDIKKHTGRISIDEDYVETLTPEYVRDHIEQNKGKYIYKVELDRAVEIVAGLPSL